jgi:hypothetical protein
MTGWRKLQKIALQSQAPMNLPVVNNPHGHSMETGGARR